ncbi:MAG: 30S ribosomal protein S21 [Candidatus Lloydbacteria bacterium]|nr:30S ribosomal protein S21 [Candidatus Lloydbacteria bacterium]
MINVEVEKNPNESAASLIRRFTKRVQGTNILVKVRGERYASRPQSKFRRKASALRRIARRAEVERLKKLGKIKTK